MKKYNIAYYFLRLRSREGSLKAINYLLSKTDNNPELREETKRFLSFNHQVKFI